MAVSIGCDIPSDERLLRGFPKSPIVLLNRLKECNKIFKNLNCFNIHCRFKHLSGNYECAHCSKKYKRQTFFERHNKLHCNICYVLQQNEHQLLEHIDKCRNSEQVNNQTLEANKYTCDLCTDQFDTNCAIAYHKALIHSDNPPSIKDLYYIRFFGSTKVYVCYYCKESSVDKEYLESHVTVLRDISKTNLNYPSDQCSDSLDVEDDLLQHETLHTITDSTVTAQYEVKRSSLDITDCIPMLPQDENINDLNPETNNAVTNVEISRNTNNVITYEEKLSDINNLISNAEQFTNNVVLNNNVENQNNKNPERNDAAQSNHEIPTLLENVEYESHIQSTVQNRDLNKSTDSNMNGLTNGTRKKTLIQSNTQILKYHCKMCEKYFTTNFALLRHMKVHHILQSLSCKLCKEVVSESSQIHKCPEIEPVRTKLETESTGEDGNDTIEGMDIEYQVPNSLPIDRFPVIRNMKSLQEELVFNIVVREVPVEFYSV
ncbi:zinc finger protein 808-like [Papilio machaon]|uniref:zinc finger protein 808-like n=1 Tax=Papilio machaon TaxID=76193 RepID=UPI001E66525E|nr:zinc finger protein 808-like [Papilio machaon]